MNQENHTNHANFIWQIANILRWAYKKHEYGNVILPFTVLRRLDCLLEGSKDQVLRVYEKNKHKSEKALELLLNNASWYKVHNRSQYTFEKLISDPDNINMNFQDYINGFSKEAKEIMENFEIKRQIKKLKKENLLLIVTKKFATIDLHPDKVSSMEMGYIFEELIRKFAEASNETAWEHFTPREVIRLMVNVLFDSDDSVLTKSGIIKTVYDPACWTGGMLSVAEKYINELNPNASLELFGQELNPESYAICKSDMLIKWQDPDHIVRWNSFTNDWLEDKSFDYMLSNPPFGVSWSKAKDYINQEHKQQGFGGRFGPGTPRVSDGSLLFLLHMVSKMKQKEKGSRIAIVFNWSPLFTGDAQSWESEIRRYIIESDMLETIIALPDDLFYNTGISTYIWILNNQKDPERKDKVQLINAVDFYEKMRKSLWEKRNEISKKQIEEISNIYSKFEETENSKIFDKEEFGYLKVRIEQPLQLNFKISEERIQNIYSERSFSKLFDEGKYKELKKKSESPNFTVKQQKKLDKLQKGKKLQEKILNKLRANKSDKLYKNRKEFKEVLDNILEDMDLKRSLNKAILNGLSKKDKTAEVCKKSGNKIKSDTDLRDYERIPFSQKVDKYRQDTSEFVEGEKENIKNYFENEVKPHVPDAWVDYSYTRVGYEIPFTRYFYEFEQPRDLEEIELDIQQVENDISDLFDDLMG